MVFQEILKLYRIKSVFITSHCNFNIFSSCTINTFSLPILLKTNCGISLCFTYFIFLLCFITFLSLWLFISFSYFFCYFIASFIKCSLWLGWRTLFYYCQFTCMCILLSIIYWSQFTCSFYSTASQYCFWFQSDSTLCLCPIIKDIVLSKSVGFYISLWCLKNFKNYIAHYINFYNILL